MGDLMQHWADIERVAARLEPDAARVILNLTGLEAIVSLGARMTTVRDLDHVNEYRARGLSQVTEDITRKKTDYPKSIYKNERRASPVLD